MGRQGNTYRFRARLSDSLNSGKPEKTAESTITQNGWCGTCVLSSTASKVVWSIVPDVKRTSEHPRIYKR